LTFEEIIRLAGIFADLGIKRMRLTGGEPLVRKNVSNLIRSLTAVPGIEDVSVTTNGVLLTDYAADLKKAGVKRINISLDTLKKDRFSDITGRDNFYKVIDGIEKAKEAAFSPLKLNMVVMKGVNDDEITDFVEFSLSQGLILRFIEFMNLMPLWREDYFLPIEEVKDICEKKFTLRKAPDLGPGPAEYYKIDGGLLGFIKTSENNCRCCNRLRLASTGELKLCLYEDGGLPLKWLLRDGGTDQEIKDAITSRLYAKETVDYKKWGNSTVHMSSIGG
jgi:cyclic pyranopterin phosphate synthase